jgi:hypothetical protein
MAQRCKTCRHPDAEQINIAIARGQSANSIAKQYGLTVDGVRRHKISGHVPQAILDSFLPQHGLSDESLSQLRRDESAGILLSLSRQRRILLEVQDRAAKARNNEWIVKVANALHRNVELVARAVGEFAQHERAVHQHNSLSVVLSPDYLRLRTGLMEIGRAHPKARSAIVALLSELEGSVPHMDGMPQPKLLEGRAA